MCTGSSRPGPHLDEALGRPSSTQEAEAYWDRCVVHNADRLPDPGVPDVVPPGRLLELPELPAPCNRPASKPQRART
ncbi:MAG: hypothetical protein IPH38_20870 [Candidatus Microthrix sp.]|nr:hypothetical protein [Candidatus Microthrix sp.]MBK7021954.1 hypothetical protein [Candidatus Microthrix sp.]